MDKKEDSLGKNRVRGRGRRQHKYGDRMMKKRLKKHVYDD